ncbi:MAG: ABC transporter substrate-binding protein [Candidatus Methylomirabilia bacterium]
MARRIGLTKIGGAMATVLAVGLLLWPGPAAFAQGKTKIVFWHAMSGRRLPAVEKLVNGFNEAHPNIQVEAQFTGKYKELLAKCIAAVRAGKPPHICQVYEVGTRTMLDSDAIVPVYTLAKGDADWGNIVTPILNYYSVGGKLYSMPFNSSTAILYYNKDIFQKAGLDPNKPPTTFKDVERMGRRIVESGAAPNAITFGWPDWTFEQMHAIHSQFYANNEDGRKAMASKVYMNRPFGVKVLERWTDWSKKKILIYGGTEYSPNRAFLASQVAMLIQSTSSVGSIGKKAKFRLGTTFLPRMKGYPRGNSVIGGATLWVIKGHPQKEYGAVWEFLKWVIRDSVTATWHKDTGYFPATNTAVKNLLDEGWFSANPNHLTAFLQILSGTRTPASQGVILGSFVQIRTIFRTAMEKALAGRATPKQALDEATAKANKALQDYAAVVKK